MQVKAPQINKCRNEGRGWDPRWGRSYCTSLTPQLPPPFIAGFLHLALDFIPFLSFSCSWSWWRSFRENVNKVIKSPDFLEERLKCPCPCTSFYICLQINSLKFHCVLLQHVMDNVTAGWKLYTLLIWTSSDWLRSPLNREEAGLVMAASFRSSVNISNSTDRNEPSVTACIASFIIFM